MQQRLLDTNYGHDDDDHCRCGNGNGGIVQAAMMVILLRTIAPYHAYTKSSKPAYRKSNHPHQLNPKPQMHKPKWKKRFLKQGLETVGFACWRKTRTRMLQAKVTSRLHAAEAKLQKSGRKVKLRNPAKHARIARHDTTTRSIITSWGIGRR